MNSQRAVIIFLTKITSCQYQSAIHTYVALRRKTVFVSDPLQNNQSNLHGYQEQKIFTQWQWTSYLSAKILHLCLQHRSFNLITRHTIQIIHAYQILESPTEYIYKVSAYRKYWVLYTHKLVFAPHSLPLCDSSLNVFLTGSQGTQTFDEAFFQVYMRMSGEEINTGARMSKFLFLICLPKSYIFTYKFMRGISPLPGFLNWRITHLVLKIYMPA